MSVTGSPLPGLRVEIGSEAVVLIAEAALHVASTAVVNGGLGAARTIVNLHVSKDDPCADPAAMLDTYVDRAGLARPCVGLLTAARTARAMTASAASATVRALAIVTVGLSNPCSAGLTAVAPPAAHPRPGTINVVVVVDADPSPAALLNAMTTVAEAKALTLFRAGVRCDDMPATGTSTDAVVVAAMGRGARHRYGGPATDLGWSVARATHDALAPAVARWLAERT